MKDKRISKWHSSFKNLLTDLFEADTANGRLFWKETGMEVTCEDKNGYKRVPIPNLPFSPTLHHVIWFFEHGEQSLMLLDHINRVRSDCRISNLRQCTHQQNMYNREPPHDGFIGARFIPDIGKWRAKIKLPDGTYRTLGDYDDELTAAIIWDAYASRIRGEFHAKQDKLELCMMDKLNTGQSNIKTHRIKEKKVKYKEKEYTPVPPHLRKAVKTKTRIQEAVNDLIASGIKPTQLNVGKHIGVSKNTLIRYWHHIEGVKCNTKTEIQIN